MSAEEDALADMLARLKLTAMRERLDSLLDGKRGDDDALRRDLTL